VDSHLFSLVRDVLRQTSVALFYVFAPQLSTLTLSIA